MSILSSTHLGGDNFKISVKLLIKHGFRIVLKRSDRYHQIWQKYSLEDGTATKVICLIDLRARNPRYFVLPDFKVLYDEPNLTSEHNETKNTSTTEEEFSEYIDGKHAVEQYAIEVKNPVELYKAIKKTEQLLKLKIIPKSLL